MVIEEWKLTSFEHPKITLGVYCISSQEPVPRWKLTLKWQMFFLSFVVISWIFSQYLAVWCQTQYHADNARGKKVTFSFVSFQKSCFQAEHVGQIRNVLLSNLKSGFSLLIPCGKIRLIDLGTATAAARAALPSPSSIYTDFFTAFLSCDVIWIYIYNIIIMKNFNKERPGKLPLGLLFFKFQLLRDGLLAQSEAHGSDMLFILNSREGLDIQSLIPARLENKVQHWALKYMLKSWTAVWMWSCPFMYLTVYKL